MKQAEKHTSNVLNLSQNALTVLQKRYLKRNEEGKVVETPEELFRRVASFVAQADSLYGKTVEEIKQVEEEFYELMTTLSFLPNSPTLMNAKRRLGQLSACFVLPVDDSMESIFDAVKYAAIIHKSGGGTGFSFSRLRPKGDVVGSTKGISSGPISFMTVFDTATEAVKQGGTRRGANMGMLRVDHPDILEFITCKDNNYKLNNFNISVGLTEAFMRAVEEDSEYDLINPRTKKISGRLRAREVFEKIVNQAWKNGEPGIVFLDRINASNPTPMLGEIESTNPCGEQPLMPYESCNLGSINLAKMVRDSNVDWHKLKETIWKAVHFLDNVIDMNKYPLKLIDEMTKANRKIGLGVMGWADMLIQLRIPYNSERAIKLAEEVMGFIQSEGRLASSALAEERGVFPNYEHSIYNGEMPVRNATVTTIAPTGSLSIIAGCSSGIEPLFAVSFVRNVMEGTKLIEVNPYFEAEAKNRGLWSRELMERIADRGSLAHFDEIPDDMKKVFVTAHDITPTDHIRMQAAFQKYVDNAVSKTVNFPYQATTKDVEDVYMLAYKLGCKGVTVYRDGSREEQVLSTSKKADEKISIEVGRKIVPKKRPPVIKGSTRLLKTGCGHLYVTINEDEDGKPFEVFTNIGKAGGCASSQSEAIGRLISLSLRSNIEPEEIVKQLKGISCHQPSWTEGGKILSCSDAIAKAIEKYLHSLNGDNGNGKTKYNEVMLIGACPECGGAVEHESGCAVCHNCGFTKCG
ncbi:ribonucleotide-diphosphate reductase subunit alpha [Dissulfurispira thermophila]|uniref:Vitamin B12-dependent ribonucleotide reductase n=2 Tax=root TaxID=1 RepID=A0A7G1GY48_9BACT|nr:vitamin B12-dependent ribonucleotide reductase [Dissulfurispira thermophila]BCB95264.1 ribonucleotide-diphosphate reductase subunit alpha [Dissulfurispira thermophila]